MISSHPWAQVRADFTRHHQMKLLLGAGMYYVGQIAARASPTNDIINDAYVNVTHMRARFPRSLPARVHPRPQLRA